MEQCVKLLKSSFPKIDEDICSYIESVLETSSDDFTLKAVMISSRQLEKFYRRWTRTKMRKRSELSVIKCIG